MRLTKLVRAGSFGRSIRSPFCFLRRSSLSAFSLEPAGLGFDDVDGEIEHVLRHLLVLDHIEIVLRPADLVRITKRRAD
jgi:hypothetical protein